MVDEDAAGTAGWTQEGASSQVRQTRRADTVAVKPFRSHPKGRVQDQMAFMFRLQHEDGTPANPPTLTSAVPNWRTGDAIPLDADRALRAVDVRDDDADQPPVLIVEDMPGAATSDAA